MIKLLPRVFLLLTVLPVITIKAGSHDSLKHINNRAAASNLSREGIMPLTWSEYELDKISDFAGGSFYYGKDASESVFKNEVHKYSIIHIASHTVINDSDPNLTHISFSDDTGEDGLLNIYEIYNLKLNAEMILLSSCNTGLGKIVTGEGAFSLARAFMYAGSPSIIMSLWDIDDRATSEIVVSFYQNLMDGKTKDESLHKAKLKYLEDSDQYTANPLYWGGLVSIGNQSTIKIDAESHRTTTFVIILSVAAIIFSVILLYPRIKFSYKII